MEKSYQPIACSFYDILQDFAVRGTYVKLTYLSALNELLMTTSIIKDFITTPNKEEFLVLVNGEELRLDRIAKVQQLVNPSFEHYFENSCS